MKWNDYILISVTVFVILLDIMIHLPCYVPVAELVGGVCAPQEAKVRVILTATTTCEIGSGCYTELPKWMKGIEVKFTQ